MSACPHCDSPCPSAAVFCSQCGEQIRGVGAASGAARARPRVPWALLLVAGGLCALAGAVVVVAYGPRLGAGAPEVVSPAAPPGDSPGPAAASREAPPTAEAAVSSAAAAAPESESAPLDERRATALLAPSTVLLQLEDDEGEALPPVEGWVVSADAEVLCRLGPLLGSHAGRCEFPMVQFPAAKVLGSVILDEDSDLAILKVSRTPADLKPLPLLEVPPFQTLRDGDRLFVGADFKAHGARAAQVFFNSADGMTRMLVGDVAGLAARPGAVLDSLGNVCGLSRVEVEGALYPGPWPAPAGQRILVDSAATLVPALGGPVSYTLAKITQTYYEGTFEDLARKGKREHDRHRWQQAIDWLEKALDREKFDLPAKIALEDVLTLLRSAYLKRGEALLVGSPSDALESIVVAALRRFSADADVLLLAGEAYASLGLWEDAQSVLLQARQLRHDPRGADLLEKSYLMLSAQAQRSSLTLQEEEYLLAGLQALPESGALRLELAKLYSRLEAYDPAVEQIRALQASADPAFSDAAQRLLDKIEDALNRRDALIIPIPQGSRSLKVTAVVDGRSELPFIIDTGASYTTIPYSWAESMGYNPSSVRHPRINVSTASNNVVVPKIQIASLSLGGYVVRNLEVLILPSGQGPQETGLIGLNFLQHFKSSLDSARGEFRLERQ